MSEEKQAGKSIPQLHCCFQFLFLQMGNHRDVWLPYSYITLGLLHRHFHSYTYFKGRGKKWFFLLLYSAAAKPSHSQVPMHFLCLFQSLIRKSKSKECDPHTCAITDSSWKEPSEATSYIISVTAAWVSSNGKGAFTKSR